MKKEEQIQQVIPMISQELPVLESNNATEFTDQLSLLISYMIKDDFNRLVEILYRLDIDERKLNRALNQYPGADAGARIALLIIERQLQKLESRRQFPKDIDIDDKDRW